MSSLDFLNDFINPARVSAGKSVHKNSAFLIKVCDELELDITEAGKIAPSGGGIKQNYFTLDKDQMMLVGMRESKAERLLSIGV
ncbi:hypothetical protein [Psychromonas sp. Urea-02u-13]|uniref:hypothetical protein n=1 Tax=Psychromonas sp. Urea-02u-13 TaxID=2058326 RepID=UPI000C322D73|nr:hypothetical protein [Psychromonas sp. Urea-02u-13]PKG37714.1 hypothetical protein CXF74_17420 [Psychromonas sp. Urea-02u-13]